MIGATAVVLALTSCGSGSGSSDAQVASSTAPTTTGTAPPSTTSTSVAPPTTSRPTTTARATTTTPPTTTATTVAATTAPATTAPRSSGTTAAPAPAVTSLSVPASVDCLTATDPGSVTVSWATSRATSVTVGIESPDPFQAGLPPQGSLTVPFAGCGDGLDKRYFVTAVDAAGRSATTSQVVKPSFRPNVAAFRGPTSVTCPTDTVRLSWEITNATSVYVAIEDPSGPFATDLPLVGSLDLPFAGCGDQQPKTYYVVAKGKPGDPPVVAERTIKPG